jgi:hypothetical protein
MSADDLRDKLQIAIEELKMDQYFFSFIPIEAKDEVTD